MEINVKVGKKDIKMGLDMELLKKVMAMGLEQDSILNKLSRDLSEKTGLSLGVSSPSLFGDLVNEAIKERGEKLFKGLAKIDNPVFALVDQSPMIVGHQKGLLYFNKIFFDGLIPALPKKYHRVFLMVMITHILLLALGNEEKDIVPQNTYFAGKLLGSVQEASEMNKHFNRIMKEL
jgi:hypothetical protein